MSRGGFGLVGGAWVGGLRRAAVSETASDQKPVGRLIGADRLQNARSDWFFYSGQMVIFARPPAVLRPVVALNGTSLDKTAMPTRS
jgi:hypothetical protein